MANKKVFGEGIGAFAPGYHEQELAWYSPPPHKSGDGLTVDVAHVVSGRADEYLNKYFVPSITPPCPRLIVDSTMWMSITPFELQSMYVPIRCARGEVAVFGLGLGYAALKMAEKPEVDRVWVWENDARVIDWFVGHSGAAARPEYSKIDIVNSSPRECHESLAAFGYDFVFSDIYERCLEDAVLADAKLFRAAMPDTTLRVWGQERLLVDAICIGLIPRLNGEEKAFIASWQNSMPYKGLEMHKSIAESTRLSLYEPICTPVLVRNLLTALGIPFRYKNRDKFEEMVAREVELYGETGLTEASAGKGG